MSEKKKMDPMLRLAHAVSQKFLDVDQRLSDIIKENLEVVIKAGLGLRSRFRKHEFNQTNGFKGELQKLVEVIAQRDVQRDALACWAKMIGERKFSVDIKEVVEKHFSQIYETEFRKALSNLVDEASKQAEQEFNVECSSLGKALDGTLAPIIAAARAKVLDDVANQSVTGKKVGGYGHDF